MSSTTITERDLRLITEKAKTDSKILGTIKYFYYISPLGWLFSRNKHENAKIISSKVWNHLEENKKAEDRS